MLSLCLLRLLPVCVGSFGAGSPAARGGRSTTCFVAASRIAQAPGKPLSQARRALCPYVYGDQKRAKARGFSVIWDHGVAWLVTPGGKRVWSLGVCVVDPGVKFDDYDVNNPAYAAWRYYPSKRAWASDAVRTLASGGFNTIGAWSDYASLLASPGNSLLMTPIIHAGSSAGFPWLDMWDPALVKVADGVTKGLIQSLKNDPRIIGYFSDNELGWWKPAVWDWVWKQKTHFERARVVQTLKQHYHGDWSKFGRDFEVVGARNWSELARVGHPFLRADCSGQPAMSDVLAMLADRYYRLCRSLVKKYAPNALYLGDRYISNYYPEVASAAGRYCDVVSTNLNPDFTDGSFVKFYLKGLEALTHRPLMITEFYMCARQGRSGNGNDRSGFPVVDTLEERADGFERTTTDLLADPNVVGAHWFQYYDEPKNGRGDGENYNFGLVDTSNRPYTELLERARSLDLVRRHEAATNATESSLLAPPAPPKVDGLVSWDRARGLVPAEQTVPRGDLYCCWTPRGFKLAMIWPEERFAEQYFRTGKIPAEARTTIVVRIPGAEQTCNIRVLDTGAEIVSGPKWHVSAVPGTTAHISITIPARAFGKAVLAANDAVAVDVRLTSECRAYTTTWRLRKTLASK
ncbi:MAG: hypothetical protein ACYC96_05565 [Fimbriimonadaceae bacterium]